MATLTSTKIKNTYDALLKATDNDAIGSTAKQITDGLGNGTPLYISTTQIGIGVTPEATYDLHVYSNAKVGGNLTVTGDLTVEGTTTTIDTQTLTVEDPLIEVASNNTSTDAVDIGWYGKYAPSGTTLYAGLFRDTGDSKFKLFRNLEEQPTTTVNTSGTGYTVATLVADLEGTLTGTIASSTVATTQTLADNSTKVATTAYVDASIGNSTLAEVLVNGNTTGGTDISVSAGDDITFTDTSKAIFGGDLEIYNTGSSFITQASGDLTIINYSDDNDVKIQCDDGSGGVTTYIKADGSSGAVELNHYGLKKFETTANGIAISGIISNLTDPSAAQDAATKNYVDTQVGANNELSEILANGNTTGGTDIAVNGTDSITFVDNSKAIFGTGNDLQIYHNGTNAVIDNATNNLQFTIAGKTILTSSSTNNELNWNHSNGNWFAKATNSNTFIIGSESNATDNITLDASNGGSATFSGDITVSGGDITLGGTGRIQGIDTVSASTDAASKGYVDSQVGANNELSEVLANGNTTGGTDIAVSSGDDITFADDSVARFGASQDLVMYHNGTSNNSRITNTTGKLYLESTNDDGIVLRTTISALEMIEIGGATPSVILSHNGNRKLYTTSTGVQVTGDVDVVSNGSVYIGDSSEGTNARLSLGASNDFLLYHFGENYIQSTGADLNINAGTQNVEITAGGVGIGVTPFSWDTSFDNIQIGNKISLWNASNNGGLSYNQYYNGTNNVYQTTDTANRFQMDADGFHFYQAASGTAGTSATFTESMRIDSSGNSTFSGNVTLSQPTNGSDAILSLISKSAAGNSRTSTIEYDADNEYMYFKNAGATVATMTSGGLVGIGTDSPESGAKLDVRAGAGGKVVFGSYDANYKVVIEAGDQLNFYNGTSATTAYINYSQSGTAGDVLLSRNLLVEANSSGGVSGAVRIDSSGRLGIGLTSPSTLLHLLGTDATVRIQGSGTSSNAGVDFFPRDASNVAHLQSIKGVDSSLTFLTGGNSGNSYVPTERMRIDSSGNVGIKNTSPSDFDTWQRQLVVGNGTADAGITIYHGSGGGNQGAIAFADGNTGTDRYRGSISYNGADEMKFYTSTLERMRITSIGTIKAPSLGGYTPTGADLRYDTSDGEIYYQTSSKRYKTDIVNLENSLDKINSLRPVRYKDINTGELACGLIAEEVIETIPEVVFKKEIDGFDEPQIEGLNYSDLIPFLTKAIQELKAEIETLKAQIN